MAFVGINSNQQDSITEVGRPRRSGTTFPFPILKDPANKIADRFGACARPRCSCSIKIARCAIGAASTISTASALASRSPRRGDLEVALDELLAGKAVSQPTTEALGCLIGRVKRPEPSGDVTYSKQIVRILQNRCVECHHEGQIAPFTLDQLRRSGGLGRDDSRSRARAPHAALVRRQGARPVQEQPLAHQG